MNRIFSESLNHVLISRNILVYIIAFLLLILFFIGYAALSPSLTHQQWDSLAYPYFAESDPIKSIWGNHPLGHLILNQVLNLVRNLNYDGRALPLFQIINSFVSALSVSVFFYVSVLFFGNTISSTLGLSFILGGSISFWLFAGSGDIYSFAIFFLLLSWVSFLIDLRSRSPSTISFSGISVGLAILAHQLNSLLIMVGIIFFWKARQSSIKRIVLFLGFSGVIVLVGFGLTGYLATSSISPMDLLHWTQGYIGDPTYGHYGNIDGLNIALWSAPKAIIAVTYTLRASLVRSGLLVVLGAMLIWGVLHYNALSREQQLILVAALAQAFFNFILITWWEPYNLKFWLLTLIPILMALMAISKPLENAIHEFLFRFPKPVEYSSKLVIPMIGLSILLFNVKFGIIPTHQEDNLSKTSIAAWVAHSHPDDLLIATDDLAPLLLYWENRADTMDLYHLLLPNRFSSDRFAKLGNEINSALCNKKVVLFEPLVIQNLSINKLEILQLSQEEIRAYFARYSCSIAFQIESRDKGWIEVCSIIGPKYCIEY